jgi:hypothetical protein
MKKTIDILDFYKRLSEIANNHNMNGRTKSTTELKKLLKEAKEAELDVDIDENLFRNAEIFNEEISYEEEEESSYEESSYDEEEESSYEDDEDDKY